MLLTNLLSFLGISIMLVISAEILVKSLTRIAFCLRLSEFVVGFMIVALSKDGGNSGRPAVVKPRRC